MAAGQRVVCIAVPQPGTTNTPQGRRGTPAFFPVAMYLSDTLAQAIALQSTQQQLDNIQLIAVLNQLNNSLNRLETAIQGQLEGLSKISVMLVAVACVIQQKNTVSSAMITNQRKVKTVYVDQGGETPQLIPVKDQIGQAVTQGRVLLAGVFVSGVANDFINRVSGIVKLTITESAPYRRLSTWLRAFLKDTFKTVLPPSATAAQSNTLAVAGSPTVPTIK